MRSGWLWSTRPSAVHARPLLICRPAGIPPAGILAMAVRAMVVLAVADVAGGAGEDPAPPVDPIVGMAPPLAAGVPREGLDDRFNLRKVPAGNADLAAIQEALKAALPVARQALVCIQFDGAAGSGAVVTPNGMILSAAHVLMEPGKRLDVVLADGRKVKAETLGLVPECDAGMARILDEGTYDFVPLGDSSELKLGFWCFALGHSGGWDAARGSVVRLGRIIRMKDGTLQSDCKLIGGDSGGPLFDLHGRLVGINSRVGSNVEESMHCPTAEFIRNDTALRKGIVVGQEKPAFLGVTTEDVEGGGVKVSKLLKDGAGQRGGLKEGDVLVMAGGQTLADKASFTKALEGVRAGERVSLRVRHADGKQEDLWLRTASKDGFEIMGAEPG